MDCNPSVPELILQFTVGGVTLRALIALLKSKLNIQGIGALALSLAVCGLAVVAYMAVTGQWAWMCFLFWWFNVFTGTQVAYRITHS